MFSYVSHFAGNFYRLLEIISQQFYVVVCVNNKTTLFTKIYIFTNLSMKLHPFVPMPHMPCFYSNNNNILPFCCDFTARWIDNKMKYKMWLSELKFKRAFNVREMTLHNAFDMMRKDVYMITRYFRVPQENHNTIPVVAVIIKCRLW